MDESNDKGWFKMTHFKVEISKGNVIHFELKPSQGRGKERRFPSILICQTILFLGRLFRSIQIGGTENQERRMRNRGMSFSWVTTRT